MEDILDICVQLTRLNEDDNCPLIQERFKCECNDKYKIYDDQSGDIICSNCGLILDERIMKHQDQFDNDDNMVQIQSSKSEFFENKIMSTIISKRMGLMSTLHIQTSINQKESYRNKEFYEIERLCTNLSTTQNIANQAKHFFHELCKMKIYRGPNRKAMMACCILRSCSVNKIIRTVTEMCTVVDIPKKILTKNIKTYESFMSIKLINERSSDEIYRHLQSLGVSEKEVFKMSNIVIKKQRDLIISQEFQGKSPKMLLAIILKSLNFEKKAICEALKVSITAF